MRNVKQSNVNIHRDSWVEINLDYLAQNIKAIRSQTPKDVKLLAVVKADAYGHGAVMLAPTLLASGADMLGVASIDEGADLRNAKISADIYQYCSPQYLARILSMLALPTGLAVWISTG